MKGYIKMLPDVVANQIAAGEVVVRPASVVKELMENAIDAQAKKITVVIRDSGKTLIQITDDGTGMSEMDARMALERHATSKIKSSEDLYNLYSLGFRGEALPSIASVSQLELKTKTSEEELGICLRVHGSELISQEYCQAQTGTSISVSQLFYNTPARRKFLKSDTVEFKHILDTFQRLALAYPEIHFALYHNDRLYYQLYPGNLRKRIVQIFGNVYENRLIPVKENTDYLQISGYIGKPEYAKKSRGEQFLFINNRFIKNFRLDNAVYRAYDRMIAEKSYPLFCLFLQLDPDKIDVNVHPAKEEVKLEDENFIYNIIMSSVKHALVQHSVPKLDFDQDPDFVLRPQPSTHTEKPSRSNKISQISWERERPSQHDAATWDDFYDRIRKSGEEITDEVPDTTTSSIPYSDEEGKDEFIPIQIKNNYILSSIKSGILLIDQQNAHERILFERFVDQRKTKPIHSQTLLFPEIMQLSSNESLIMEEILPHVRNLGFLIEPFGRNTYVLQGMPDIPMLENRDKLGIIRQILDEFSEERTGGPDINEKIAHIFAKNFRVKKNKKLNPVEIKTLVNQLFACHEPAISPSGKKCFITFNTDDIEKQFS